MALVSFVVSLAAYDYISGLLARSPVLGAIALGLVGLFCLVLAIMALRELAAFARLRRLDGVHQTVTSALVQNDLGLTRDVIAKLNRLYASRDDTAWGRARLAEQSSDVLDEDGLLGLAETTLLVPLDAAARQVATVTAISCRWRLTRTVLIHLVTTGAVAVGDDLIGSIAGGGVLSKASRRFGEGVINGALTARVGVAALSIAVPRGHRSQHWCAAL